MTDGDALFEAILANPADDLPRLVYADWLDDTGTDPARGYFIRVQCGPQSPKSSQQASKLLRKNRHRWLIPDLPQPTVQEFNRGFVAGIRTLGDLFLAGAGQIGRSAPVTALHLSNVVARLSDLAVVDWLPRVEELNLTNNVGIAAAMPRLLALPVPRLRELELRNCQLYPSDIAELMAAAEQFHFLERLTLNGNPLGDEGVGYLAEANFPRLEKLDLRCDMLDESNSIHATGAAALAASPRLGRLRRLDLSGHYIGDAGLAALARSPHLTGLESLSVADNEIGEAGSAGIEAVVESPYLRRLTSLVLTDNRIDRLAAESLVGWSRIGDVRVALHDCEFAPGARDVILKSKVRDRFLVYEDNTDESSPGEPGTIREPT